MAIAFDTASVGNVNPGTSLTFAHTCSGQNRMLFVGIALSTTSDIITAVTYAGAAMTRINALAPSEGYYLYYLVNPDPGANNVVVTISASQTIQAAAASYTGAAWYSPIDASTTASNASTTTLTTSVTTIADKCWVVMFAKNTVDAVTAGASTTLRTASNVWGILDSNGPKTPSGSRSLISTGSATQRITHLMASFVPAPATQASAFSLLMALRRRR